MKILKRIFKILLVIIAIPLVYVGGMIAYASITDYKPIPEEAITLKGVAAKSVIDTDTLTFFNWNIGFAGLGEESDFFYDGGKKVHMPKAIVEKNLSGILKTVKDYRDQVDFFLLQEVDVSSSRSYKVDEVGQISEQLPGFVSGFGANYKVNFIPIPLTNPLGKVYSGLSTWTKYAPTETSRYSFEGNYDWPTYLFFLDRCFLLMRYPLANGKELILINTHNSAYDSGGNLKKKQMEQMKAVLAFEYAKGNYVIVGGDWNQYPAGYAGLPGFPAKKDDKQLFVPRDYPGSFWKWVYDPRTPTNRSLSAPFDPKTTEQGIIDFYLLSPNVELLEVHTLNQNFSYSDHQPVLMTVVVK
jgi:endonuclease/exonuclease/phosphatase family metal-dependent hydrolase